MKNLFQCIKATDIPDNVFKAIGDDWMLITAGHAESWNTMTASWGSLGILWNLPVAICFIRPQRYTYEFVEKSSSYTLSFFDDEYRNILNFCGTKSGRHHDKAAETGLNVFTTGLGNIGFGQARLILECKKIYADDIKPDNFIHKELIDKIYPKEDFHRFFIGRVENVLIR